MDSYGNKVETETSRTEILTFGVGTFIILISIFAGVVHHRKSKSPALQFLAQRHSYPFYIASVVCSLFILMSASLIDEAGFSDAAFVMIALLIFTIICVVCTISILGCKFYRSFLLWRFLKLCNIGAKSFVFFGYFLGLGILVLYVYYGYEKVYQPSGSEFYQFILVAHIGLFAFTSVASLASKIAQLQWIVVAVFLFLLLNSGNADCNGEEIDCRPEEYFTYWWLFWEAMFCILLAIVSIFGFSPFSRLREIFMTIPTSFLAIFDIITDITVIELWFRTDKYAEACLQILCILAGSIFSARYIDNYYYIHESMEDQSGKSIEDDDYEEYAIKMEKKRKHRIFCGRFWTLFGFGRIFHSTAAWDEDNKDMGMSEKILIVWEMIFESFPTIILQLYIQMVDRHLSLAVLVSIIVSFISITYTIIGVLYYDHHSKTRERDMQMNMNLVGHIDVTVRRRFGTDLANLDPLRIDHPAVYKLLSFGYSMPEIQFAWVQLKSNPNELISVYTEDTLQFVSVMTYILKKTRVKDAQAIAAAAQEERDVRVRRATADMIELNTMVDVDYNNDIVEEIEKIGKDEIETEVSVDNPEYDGEALLVAVQNEGNVKQIPSVPSSSAPKPMYPGQSKGIPSMATSVHSFPHQQMGVQSFGVQQRPPQAQSVVVYQQRGQTMPIQPQIIYVQQPLQQMPVIQQQVVYKPPEPMVSTRELDVDHLYLDFSHPNVNALYLKGYDVDQIKTAYYIMKRERKQQKRGTKSADSSSFVSKMVDIMTKYKISPNRGARRCGCCCCLCDVLWQNFICCFFCKFISNCRFCEKTLEKDKKKSSGCCCKKKNTDDVELALAQGKEEKDDVELVLAQGKKGKDDKQEPGKAETLGVVDNFFYLAVYLFVITDFFVRIYAILLLILLLSESNKSTINAEYKEYIKKYALNYLIGVAVFLFYCIFECSWYYYMLKPEFKKLRSALKYFWVGMYSCSYWFLSAMHLSYLPCNVDLTRLMREQMCRLVVQSLMIGALVFAQYEWYQYTWDPFFELLITYAVSLVVNACLIFIVSRFMKTFEKKIIVAGATGIDVQILTSIE